MEKSRGFSFVRENKHKKTSLPQDSGLEEVSMLIDAIFSPASQHFHKTNTMNVAQIIYAFVKKILRPYWGDNQTIANKAIFNPKSLSGAWL